MARSRLCRVCKDFHDLEKPWPHNCVGHFGTIGNDPGFYVISDTMPAIESHADGRMYDSKSQYRRGLRAAGCVELGNDRVKREFKPMPPVGPDIKRAMEQLESR